MSAQHTPGPWEVTEAKGPSGEVLYLNITAERATDDIKYRGDIASLMDAEHIDGITKAERDANARLFVAAPALLDVLQTIVTDLEDGDDFSALQIARSAGRYAIAKAIGDAA